jgi:hypothetical protein
MIGTRERVIIVFTLIIAIGDWNERERINIVFKLIIAIGDWNERERESHNCL